MLDEGCIPAGSRVGRKGQRARPKVWLPMHVVQTRLEIGLHLSSSSTPRER
jgi:hypothetical protein